MRDDIFYGNLIGLLKRGRWSLSLEESQALIAIYQEAVKRSQPPVITDPDPITKPKKTKAVKNE